VPPNRRVVEVSAWEKAAKTVSSFSGGIPIPVSATEKCRSVDPPASAASAASRSTRTTTSPRAVNLMALPTRLTRI
jgi:hypothetical protein